MSKAAFALGFHLLGVSLPALQVNLRNHLAHPPGPGNATTMPMEPNSCGPHPADAHGPFTIVLGALQGGAPCGLAVVGRPGERMTVRNVEGPPLQAFVAEEVNPGPLFQVVPDEIRESCWEPGLTRKQLQGGSL